MDVYKIGSGEMTDIPMLERIAGFGKPMVVSTGMCTFEEIDRTYNALIAKKFRLRFCTVFRNIRPYMKIVI